MTGLRIIGGAFKGRRLVAPPGLETRPLPDRVKQSLFDWLGQRLDGLHVVDCCAGSGAFAFEALSRGAGRVDAIEPGRHALPALRVNAAKLGNPPGLVVHALPLETVLPRLGGCLGRLLAEASGRTRKQLLASGRVRVNGATARRADVALAAGDVVELATRGPRAALPPGLQLRHEDDELIVVDKPAGLLTIATEHERRRTVYAHLTALA